MVRKIKSNVPKMKDLSKAMGNIDETLSLKEFEVTSGGAIKIKANAKKEILSIKLDESLNIPDKEMLEDLLLSAFNQVSHKAEEIANSELANSINFSTLF